MIIVFGDILADLCLRIRGFPLLAGDLHRTEFVELGPGGAGNVAITLARLGRQVTAMGEIGDDELGEIVCRGLQAEGVGITTLAVSPGGRTPLACVLVDERGEPAYAGYPGSLQLGQLLEEWQPATEHARALFTDGWAEHPGAARMAVDILRRCRLNGIPTFFDPGPGNPALDNAWHRQAMAAAQVVLVNEAEAERLTGLADPRAAAPALLSLGPEWAIVKLGGRGCIVQSGAEQVESPAFQVPLVDATGAGDSFAAAVIDGFLRGLPPKDVAVVANATGAAKVQKRGTGRQMPTRDEIRTVLLRGGIPPDKVMRLFP